MILVEINELIVSVINIRICKYYNFLKVYLLLFLNKNYMCDLLLLF